MLQFRKLMHKSIIVFIGLAALAFSTLSIADNPTLKTAKEKTDKCVKDTAYMRSNHMDELLHQRNTTMRQGIRTEKFSLKACINCHVPEDAKFEFGDSQHFCSSCHNYVGVSIDCFQCHMDTPMGKKNPHTAQTHKPVSTDIAETKAEGDSNE